MNFTAERTSQEFDGSCNLPWMLERGGHFMRHSRAARPASKTPKRTSCWFAPREGRARLGRQVSLLLNPHPIQGFAGHQEMIEPAFDSRHSFGSLSQPILLSRRQRGRSRAAPQAPKHTRRFDANLPRPVPAIELARLTRLPPRGLPRRSATVTAARCSTPPPPKQFTHPCWSTAGAEDGVDEGMVP